MTYNPAFPEMGGRAVMGFWRRGLSTRCLDDGDTEVIGSFFRNFSRSKIFEES